MKKRLLCLCMSILMLLLCACGSGEENDAVTTMEDTTVTSSPEETTDSPEETTEPVYDESPTPPEVKYLILCLDFRAKDPVLEWASEVIQVLIDPQSIDKTYSVGGTGMVAMFYFSEAGEVVAVEYYSTVRDAYKPLHLFEVK